MLSKCILGPNDTFGKLDETYNCVQFWSHYVKTWHHTQNWKYDMKQYNIAD